MGKLPAYLIHPTMEDLTQTLQSYLHLREALLRKLTTKSTMDFSCYTAIDMAPSVRRRRQADPTTWRFDELAQLARVVGVSDRAVHSVKWHLFQVKQYVETLPDKERQRFYKSCQLSPKKIDVRLQDQQYWRIVELERMILFFQSVSQ